MQPTVSVFSERINILRLTKIYVIIYNLTILENILKFTMKTALIPKLSNSGSYLGRSRGGCSIGGSTSQERQESGGRRILFIKEQVLRNPKSAVSTNKGYTNHKGRNKHRSNASQKYDNSSGDEKANKCLPIRKLSAEDRQRRI